MARARNADRRNLPANLYVRNGYYWYRDPTTAKTFGLGRDAQAAIAQAIEANVHNTRAPGKATLLERLNGHEKHSISELLARFRVDLKHKDLAPTTLRSKKCALKAVEDKWAKRFVTDITTADVDELLQVYVTQDKLRMGMFIRSTIVEVFRKAMAIGWATMNPAEIAEAPRAKVRRARLTYPVFLQIMNRVNAVEDGWMKTALLLALITGQRREDIAAMRFQHIHDGRLWVQQHKTGNRVAIPLSLHSPVLPGASLEWVVTEARLSGVISRYLVHHTVARTHTKLGDPVHPDTLTRGFARVRDFLQLDWGDRAPATFHEIRSLATRLYREHHGKDFAQALAGHKDSSTTDLYTDARGEWVMVSAI